MTPDTPQKIRRGENALIGALFVDYENLFYYLANREDLLHQEAAAASVQAVLTLREQYVREGVTLVYERAYADWEQIPANDSTQRELAIQGVAPRYVDSRKDKSTADIELSLDLQALLLGREEMDRFVLVGGDRDYLPILRRVKERHREVDICAYAHTLSGDVREFASRYPLARIVELDRIVDLERYRAKATIIRPVPMVSGAGLSTQPTSGTFTAAPSRSLPSVGSSLPSGSGASGSNPGAAPSGVPATKVVGPDRTVAYDPDKDYEWEERYLTVMHRFLREKGYSEIHLGPFFRYLKEADEMSTLSTQEQKRVFENLRAMNAVLLEERDSGQGYTWSAARLNVNHPLVQKTNG